MRFPCILALVLVTTSGARADKASGTWTGQAEARGNYYWERSTRVVAPQVGLQTEAPNGVKLRGQYLLDAITSASVAAGTLVDRRFTETRHDGGLGGGYEFNLGEAQLDVNLDGRVSTEPDYFSKSGTLTLGLSLHERATVLQLQVTYLHDIVKTVLRDASGPGAATRVGTLESTVLSALWIQTLSPVAALAVGYDLGVMDGFLQNPYRSVSLGAAPLPEKHPDERIRHTGHARFEYYLPGTRTALHAIMRVYGDTWDILAITPEARLYQEIQDAFVLRLRYRFYTQTNASFQKDSYAPTDTYYTADPKMTRFYNQLVGTQVVVPLAFLERTALDFAWRASVDFSFEYLWNTNAFGNATIVQGGLLVPF